MWRDVRIGIMKAVPENIRLSKNLFQQISWTWVPQSYPELPRGDWSQVQHHRVHSLQRQMANALIIQFSSLQSLSHVWLFVTPLITARQASLSITNSRSSLRFTFIKSVMSSSHLILCCPLLLLPPISPSIRVFSNESTLHVRWPKYWSFSTDLLFLCLF